MSDLTKRIVDQARLKGAIAERNRFFSVTDKRQVPDGIGGEVTIEVPNGIHDVVILSEKMGTGKGYNGEEQQELQMIIKDNGVQMFWNVPIMTKSNDGKKKLYYLIEDLQPIEIGEHFSVEAVKMKNGHYAKRITRGASHLPASKVGGEVPTIQLNDDEDSTEALPSLSPEDDINPEDIPF